MNCGTEEREKSSTKVSASAFDKTRALKFALTLILIVIIGILQAFVIPWVSVYSREDPRWADSYQIRSSAEAAVLLAYAQGGPPIEILAAGVLWFISLIAMLAVYPPYRQFPVSVLMGCGIVCICFGAFVERPRQKDLWIAHKVSFVREVPLRATIPKDQVANRNRKVELRFPDGEEVSITLHIRHIPKGILTSGSGAAVAYLYEPNNTVLGCSFDAENLPETRHSAR